MKKMWKQMAMALIGIGAVLSVSACGGKENTTSNEPQTTANVAESEAKTEIKVALWDYTSAEYFKKLIEEFEKNNEDILQFEIRVYPQIIQRVRETYPGYDFEKEFEDEGIYFDVFSRKEMSGENTYIMYFYCGKEKYIVIGRNDEDRLQDIVIEYKDVIVNYYDNE